MAQSQVVSVVMDLDFEGRTRNAEVAVDVFELEPQQGAIFDP